MNSARIVEILEHIRVRRGMYFAPISVEACDTFLGGFVTGCFAFGVSDATVRILDATHRRGWTVFPTGPIPEMRQKKMSEEEIMDELIAIHIDAFSCEDNRGPMRPLEELS